MLVTSRSQPFGLDLIEVSQQPEPLRSSTGGEVVVLPPLDRPHRSQAAAALRRARRLSGLNVFEFAEAITRTLGDAASPDDVGQWEVGQRSMPAEVLLAAGQVVRVETEILLGRRSSVDRLAQLDRRVRALQTQLSR